jgi:hypothetical protein
MMADDDAPFCEILESMGVHSYDPMVPVALNEHAARKKVIT